MMIWSALPLLVLALVAGATSCSAPTQGPARKPSAGTTPPAPSTSDPAGPVEQDGVVLLPSATSAGPAFRIGSPPLRLVSEYSARQGVPLALGGDIVVAGDGTATGAIWDVTSGSLLRRVSDPEGYAFRPLVVLASSKGTFAAFHFGGYSYLLREPFTGPMAKLPCSASDFSDDERSLLCLDGTPKIIDLTTLQVIASATDGRDLGESGGPAFSADGRSAYWARRRGVVRWDFQSGGTVTQVFTVPSDLSRVSFAQSADVALFLRDAHKYRADLRTGKISPVVPDAMFSFTLRPSGRAVSVLRSDTYVSLDLVAKSATSLLVAPGAEGPLAFTGDESRFAFVTRLPTAATELAYELRVYEAGRGLRSYGEPTRFDGWTSEGKAVLTRKGRRWALTLPSGERAAAPVVRAPNSTKGTPWLQLDGSVVPLIATQRAGALPHMRTSVPCEGELRRVQQQGTSTFVAKADCPTEDQETDEELDGKGRLHLGWFVGKGWLLEGLTSKLILRDGTGAIRATRMPPLAGPDDPPANGRFWTFAFSPDGRQLAVIWRRHDFGPDVAREPDPRRDSVHIAEARDQRQCVGTGTSCQWEYYLELWSLENAPKAGSAPKDWPKRVWRERLTGAPRPGQRPTAKAPFGPLGFDATGERLFVGFADGDVLVRALRGYAPAADDAAPVGPLVSVHQLAVTKLSPSPDGRWMFSEDISAEQRVWQLPGR